MNRKIAFKKLVLVLVLLSFGLIFKPAQSEQVLPTKLSTQSSKASQQNIEEVQKINLKFKINGDLPKELRLTLSDKVKQSLAQELKDNHQLDEAKVVVELITSNSEKMSEFKPLSEPASADLFLEFESSHCLNQACSSTSRSHKSSRLTFLFESQLELEKQVLLALNELMQVNELNESHFEPMFPIQKPRNNLLNQVKNDFAVEDNYSEEDEDLELHDAPAGPSLKDSNSAVAKTKGICFNQFMESL
jgi:hypothetical protein